MDGLNKELSIIHPSTSKEGENGIDSELYQSMLNLLPTLKEAISDRIASEFEKKPKHILKTYKLPFNNHLPIKEELENKKLDLTYDLEKLYELNGGKAPIIVIVDDCFTNNLLLKLLEKILEEKFEKLVSVIHMSYTKYENKEWTEELDKAIEKNIHNNSIIILWGSYSDTYSVNPNMYNSKLAKIIKNIASSSTSREINNRMLGVCFGQQFIANIIWIMNINKENIIATVKWSAQFGPSVCNIKSAENLKPVFAKALQGIRPYNWDNKITTTFTRTWHVDFDLLDNKWKEQVIPLITDDISWDTVWWGSKNGKIIWVQFHPEISLHRLDNVKEEIEKIIHHLEKYYKKDIHYILKNFNLGEHSQKFNDIWEYFYTYLLHAFTEDILEKKVAGYSELTNRLMNKIMANLGIISFNKSQFFNPKEKAKIIEKIDQNKKLELNYNIDRKVDRWIKTYSEIIWIENLSLLTLEHKKFLENLWYKWPYFVCDLGAGNGTFIRELYEETKWNNVIIYGVGDKIYLDLYQGIMKSKYWKEIPKDIIQLIMRTLYIKQKKTEKKWSLIKDIKKILRNIEIDPNLVFYIPFSCIEKNNIFINKQTKILSKESKKFLKENQNLLQKLLNDIQKNIYNYFYGYFERIYISEFSDFQLNEKDISNIDMQISVRSTSHLDDDEYKEVIINYLDNFSNPWSFFIDNGVHRSYTNVPRLKQLSEIESLYKKRINIKLIYDTKTNYFSSVIIESIPFHGDEFWKRHLAEDKILVDIEEAYRSTFFKFETFIRNFIIINFKNYGVFWNHNSLIINCVNKCVNLQKEKKYHEIKEEIVNLVNIIIDNIQQIKYNYIDIDVLEGYYDNDWKNINEISNEKFFTANWISNEVKRKN